MILAKPAPIPSQHSIYCSAMSVSPNSVNGRINDGTYVIHSVQDKKEDERLVLTAKNAAVVTEKDVVFKVWCPMHPNHLTLLIVYRIVESGLL